MNIFHPVNMVSASPAAGNASSWAAKVIEFQGTVSSIRILASQNELTQVVFECFGIPGEFAKDPMNEQRQLLGCLGLRYRQLQFMPTAQHDVLNTSLGSSVKIDSQSMLAESMVETTC